MGPSIQRRAGAALAICVVPFLLQAPLAAAGPGYRLDATQPSIALSAQAPIGVAVDQSSQDVYVAEASRSLSQVTPGLVEQLTAAGTPTASSPFVTGGQDFFASVAVNPATGGIYAYQFEASTPYGQKGTHEVNVFSSTGVLGGSFAVDNAKAGTIAADASGRLLFPNDVAGSVQIFDSSGNLLGAVTCGGCPGGGFSTPQAVALGPGGKLYVVDSSGGGSVLVLSPSGGSYAYESTLQSGKGAVGVAVDGASGNVFVGDRVGSAYHVVAYDSSGTAFDDFGAGLATPAQVEAVTGQLAINATTHRLYLSDPGGNKLWTFEPAASIPAPMASATAPSSVGQVEATLRAEVETTGHVLTGCHFEYTDHADFLANGFANAQPAPCPAVVGGEQAVTVSASVKGLDPGTSYDYRISIADFGGADESGSQSFQTLPPLPPEATTGAATSLTKTTATLAGTVNPKGGPVSNCHFEYLTEAAFQSSGFAGATTKLCSLAPSGNAAVAVTAKVTGLLAGTAYRARVVATNNSGTTQAAESSFTTVAETCAENAALCPPEEPAPADPPVITPPSPSPTPSPPAKKGLTCRKGFKKKRVHGKLRCVRVKKRGSRRH
jgi:hypothetical protein